MKNGFSQTNESIFSQQKHILLYYIVFVVSSTCICNLKGSQTKLGWTYFIDSFACQMCRYILLSMISLLVVILKEEKQMKNCIN